MQLEAWESSFKAAKQDLQEALQKVSTKADRTSFKHRVKQFLAEAVNMAKEVEKALFLPAAPTVDLEKDQEASSSDVPFATPNVKSGQSKKATPKRRRRQPREEETRAGKKQRQTQETEQTRGKDESSVNNDEVQDYLENLKHMATKKPDRRAKVYNDLAVKFQIVFQKANRKDKKNLNEAWQTFEDTFQ